jgi:aminoglycoside phosphotransferase
LSGVIDFIQHNRERFGLDGLGVPEQLTYVMETPRFRTSNHVVFLILPAKRPYPILVAKVPRLADSTSSLRREFKNLRAVHLFKEGGFDSIPRVVAFEEYIDRPILIETALVGEKLDPTAVRKDHHASCQMVIDWLSDFQLSGISNNELLAERFDVLINIPLTYFEKVFPLSLDEVPLFDQTWELAQSICSGDLPIVFEHGDLSHPNIIVLEDGNIGVVDWELAEPYGLVGYDLFFFLTFVAFSLSRADSRTEFLSAFKAAFFGRSAWSRSYIRDYASRLKIPIERLAPIFVLSWMRYLSNLILRMGAHTKIKPEMANWVRSNRYYLLWQYSVEHFDELYWNQ